MKPYKTEVEVTTKYNIEVHAETETDAIQTVENLNLDAIEDAGDFKELVGVSVTDIEAMQPEDDENENDEIRIGDGPMCDGAERDSIKEEEPKENLVKDKIMSDTVESLQSDTNLAKIAYSTPEKKETKNDQS